jgi:hypothetical protein
MNRWIRCAVAGVLLVGCVPVVWGGLERIGIRENGRRFVLSASQQEFILWGFNYDHDRDGRLLEEYWEREWDTVAEDFAEMKSLGANTVRIHLQLGAFMKTPEDPNQTALDRLSRLLTLAERTGLYLDLTGLGCYHKQDVPGWYDALDEAARWGVQARFWKAVAGVGAGRSAVFCYDLMNEPIVPGEQKETDWLAGEFGGKHFVQRISLERAGRTPEQIAEAWVKTLTAAIRKEDTTTLVTVGVIPWAMTFPNAKPIFYAAPAARHLDFVSVHFYPERGKTAEALAALAVYDIGKPLVIEEMFPLKCSIEELEQFMDGSRGIADGWLSFYWGQTISEYEQEDTFVAAIMKEWLRFYKDKKIKLHP